MEDRAQTSPAGADGVTQLEVTATDEPQIADSWEDSRPKQKNTEVQPQLPQSGQPHACEQQQPQQLVEDHGNQGIQQTSETREEVPQQKQQQQVPPVKLYSIPNNKSHPHHAINLSMVPEELSSWELEQNEIGGQQYDHPLQSPPSLIPAPSVNVTQQQSVAFSEMTAETSEGRVEPNTANEPPLPPTNLDLEMGVDHPSCKVSIRASAAQPMNTRKRRRNIMKRRFQQMKRHMTPFNKNDDDDDDEDDDDDSGKEEPQVSFHGRLMVQQSHTFKHHAQELQSSTFSPSSVQPPDVQYRLTASKRTGRNSLLGIPGAGRLLYDSTETSNAQCNLCPSWFSDRMATRFLHWSFRSPFVLVFGTAAIAWLGLTFVFALFIWLIGREHPTCIGGPDHTTTRSPFLDCWTLSWTTFSTVGYGLVYPAISSGEQAIYKCTHITILTTFESFTGIMFSSLCSALMFAKIARVQGFAQVKFSDPMVIRYGTGLVGNEADDGDNSSNASGNSGELVMRNIPCPVLEFRIVNRLNTTKGGEIIDATLNMVASIDASQADPSLVKAAGRRRKGKKGKRKGPTRPASRGSFRSSVGRSDDDDDEEGDDSSPAPVTPPPTVPGQAPGQHSVSQPIEDVLRQQQPAPYTNDPNVTPMTVAGETFHRFSNTVPRRRLKSKSEGSARASIRALFGTPHPEPPPPSPRPPINYAHAHTFEEDQNGKFLPKKVIAKLEVESPDHPFFRRAWLIRHTLDMSSPLLKPEIREMVARNNGFWPKELNSHESIRSSIQFDQILVSLSGTSNADANSVYAQHVYHKIDVNIGYRFVNMLYRHRDGTLRVDSTLLSDVMEQVGGGGEPFQQVEENTFQDMLVL